MNYQGKKGIIAYSQDKKPFFLPISGFSEGVKVILLPDKQGQYIALNPNPYSLRYGQKVALLKTTTGYVIFNPYFSDKLSLPNMDLSISSNFNSILVPGFSFSAGLQVSISDEILDFVKVSANLGLTLLIKDIRDLFEEHKDLSISSGLNFAEVLPGFNRNLSISATYADRGPLKIMPFKISDAITETERPINTVTLLTSIYLYWDGVGQIYLSGSITEPAGFQIRDSFGIKRGPFEGGGSGQTWLANQEPHILYGPINLTSAIQSLGTAQILNFFIMNGFQALHGTTELYLINVRT